MDIIGRRNFMCGEYNYLTTRNVRLIRSDICFLLFGIWWSQWCWVQPFINKKLPCSKTIFRFSSCLVLCFIWKVRVSPKLTEPMIGFFPSSFSSSLCQETLSEPVRYKFTNTHKSSNLHTNYSTKNNSKNRKSNSLHIASLRQWRNCNSAMDTKK